MKGIESAFADNGGYSDRYYFRVRCPDHQVVDLSYDAAQNVWTLVTASPTTPTPCPSRSLTSAWPAWRGDELDLARGGPRT
jgi:hypothetical protein